VWARKAPGDSRAGGLALRSAHPGLVPTGQTPVHSVRVPDHIWNEASKHAGPGGMSQLIVTLLERHNAAQRRRSADRAQPPDRQ
jgi:hypothetical protein